MNHVQLHELGNKNQVCLLLIPLPEKKLFWIGIWTESEAVKYWLSLYNKERRGCEEDFVTDERVRIEWCPWRNRSRAAGGGCEMRFRTLSFSKDDRLLLLLLLLVMGVCVNLKPLPLSLEEKERFQQLNKKEQRQQYSLLWPSTNTSVWEGKKRECSKRKGFCEWISNTLRTRPPTLTKHSNTCRHERALTEH